MSNLKQMAQEAATTDSTKPATITLNQWEKYMVSRALRLQEMDLKKKLKEPISRAKAESLSNELAHVVSLAKYIEIQ